jgi:hypothetical protein
MDENLVEPLAHPQDLARSDVNVGRLAAEPRVRALTGAR